MKQGQVCYYHLLFLGIAQQIFAVTSFGCHWARLNTTIKSHFIYYKAFLPKQKRHN